MPESLNAVIYARYSSHSQTEQSIEGQLHDCYAYADRCGYRVVGEYIDRALTGKNDDRPDFQRMIKDAEKRQFQLILVGIARTSSVFIQMVIGGVVPANPHNFMILFFPMNRCRKNHLHQKRKKQG